MIYDDDVPTERFTQNPILFTNTLSRISLKF